MAIPGSTNGLPVTSIGNSAFAYESGLTSVTIPNSVTSIGSGAFSDCSGLTNASIGTGTKTIGTAAFRGCSRLAGITIPGAVTSIGSEAFDSCTTLAGIAVDAANPVYSSTNGVLFNKTQTDLITCPGGKAGTYAVPGSTATIGSEAFRNCRSLTAVSFPNSVTTIGSDAFYYCSSLSFVAMPNSLTSLADYTFMWCTSLTNITLPSTVASIGQFAFWGCGKLTDANVASGVTNIGQAAFGNCTNLGSITVDPLNSAFSSPEGVLFNKSRSALVQCPAGKTGNAYIIPTGVTSIAPYAFYSCANFTNILIPNGVTGIGRSAFGYCTKMASLAIPEGVGSVGDLTFADCTALGSVRVPNSVTSIGVEAFTDCTSLTNVTLGVGVASIGAAAFYPCTALRAAYCMGSAPIAGSDVFQNDNSTTVYYLPGSTGWGPTFGGRPTAIWQILTLTNLLQSYDGTAKPVSVTTMPPGLAVAVTYNGSPSAPTNAGSYSVVGTVVDSYYQGGATNTLVVGKATATVSLANLSQVYDGTARSAAVTIALAGLGVSLTYNGSTNPPVNPGSYAVVATVSDPNYEGSATGVLRVLVQLTAAALDSQRRFQFSFLTAADVDYTIEISTDLKNWVPGLALRGYGGPVTILDPNAAGVPQRFYRLAIGP